MFHDKGYPALFPGSVFDYLSIGRLFSDRKRLFLNSGNYISDIGPLAFLTQLKEINLAYNPLRSVDSLSGLTNLESLDLSYTGLSDISHLKNLIQ